MAEVPTVKLSTGAQMPVIGFGTWQILFRARQKVQQALDAGYRLIDTAKIYGNENSVGEAVKRSSIDRKDIFVTTKLWNNDQGYESTHQAFNQSLERLGLEYIDLYLIHWPGHDTRRRRESWRALEEIYHAGQAKAIGVSNYKVEHLRELLDYASVKPAVNQIEFHPFIYSDQQPILDLCQQQGIVVEAYSPLAHGRHANDPVINDIAKQHSANTAQIMLAWAMVHNTIPIPKTTDPGRMKQNLASVHVKLTTDDINRINKLSRGEHVLPWH